MAQCPALDARYHMAADPDGAEAQLVLTRNPEPTAFSDLRLALRVAGRAEPFLFDPVQSQGYGSVFAAATADDLQDVDLPLSFLETGQSSRLVDYAGILPQSAAAAPDVIAITGLGSALWYATNGQPDPVILSQQLWYLVPCD